MPQIVRNQKDKKATLADVKVEARRLTLQRLRDNPNFEFSRPESEIYPEHTAEYVAQERATKEAVKRGKQASVKKQEEKKQESEEVKTSDEPVKEEAPVVKSKTVKKKASKK